MKLCARSWDECAELVEGDSAVEGGAKVVEGVDFLNYLDRGGRERASDGPGEAGPLAAEDGGLVEDDNFALFIAVGCFQTRFRFVAQGRGAGPEMRRARRRKHAKN